MEEEQGDAAFASFQGENFRFGVGRVDDVGHIWLENQVSKQRWECEVADVAQFAPTDVVLPQNTVLHYVAASLKESAASSDSGDLGPNLVRQDEDETLQLEVSIKLGVAGFVWTPKYVFPMTLAPPELSPAEVQSGQINHLTTQVEELQEEVKMLKEQMAAVLSAQAASQQTPAPSSPSQESTTSGSPSQSSEPVPPSTRNTVEDGHSVSTLSRKDQVWGDIIGHPCHQLALTPEFRETQSANGVVMRKHRQHACKVCSALRRDRKRPLQTANYCPECTKKHNGGMVFLCDKVRLHDIAEYRHATCSQIWHVVWNNGEDIPQSGTSSIRMRKKLKTTSTADS